jgi:hypothetical protein
MRLTPLTSALGLTILSIVCAPQQRAQESRASNAQEPDRRTNGSTEREPINNSERSVRLVHEDFFRAIEQARPDRALACLRVAPPSPRRSARGHRTSHTDPRGQIVLIVGDVDGTPRRLQGLDAARDWIDTIASRAGERHDGEFAQSVEALRIHISNVTVVGQGRQWLVVSDITFVRNGALDRFYCTAVVTRDSGPIRSSPDRHATADRFESETCGPIGGYAICHLHMTPATKAAARDPAKRGRRAL